MHTRADRFDAVAIGLHWLMAAGILAAVALGAYMTGLPLSPSRLRLFNWHKWLGATLLALALVRLAWRLGHRPPPRPPMAAWQARAAAGVQALLYALFVATPLAGWAYTSAAGFPLGVFGLLPLPDWVAPDRELARSLKALHVALAWTLATLALLHVAAALKHQFLDGDALLGRMWPRAGGAAAPDSDTPQDPPA